MLDWSDIKTKEQLQKKYFSYLPALQKIAMSCGYALAIHGSVMRDMDLIAVPWVPKALAPETLVYALEGAMRLPFHSRKYWKDHAETDPKPFGRKAYIIWVARLNDSFEGENKHAMFDLSIMPRLNP